MGSSWSRRDRIIRLAKLRGDKAALAIMNDRDALTASLEAAGSVRGASPVVTYRQSLPKRHEAKQSDATRPWYQNMQEWTESELRAAWGDR